MAYERFANGGLSSLAAGINNAVTSLTVKSAVGFPTGGNFRIIIDNEIMSLRDVTPVTALRFRLTGLVRAREDTVAGERL